MIVELDLHTIYRTLQHYITNGVCRLLVILLGGLLFSFARGWLKRKSIRLFEIWRSSPFFVRIFLPALVIADVIAGGGKSSNVRSLAGSEIQPVLLQSVGVVSGYNAPIEGVTDEDVFLRPEGAFTPSRWQGFGVSDDWQLMPGDFCACIGGIVTTQGYGLSDWNHASPDLSVYAPSLGEYSLLPGVSDFWCVTNALYKRFVWKDVANSRNPDYLISFAAQVSECGDVIYVYNDAALASTNSVSFFQKECERMVVAPSSTNACAVLVEKDRRQSPKWWMEQYPELCSLSDDGEIVWNYDENEYYQVDVEIDSFATDHLTRGTDLFKVKLAQPNSILVITRDGVPRYDVLPNGVFRRNGLVFRAGVVYEITAKVSSTNGYEDCMVSDVTVPTGVIWSKINDYKYRVWRPINLQIATVDLPSCNAYSCRASLNPAVCDGAYSWSATGPFRIVSPHAQTTEVFRNGPGVGTLQCVWSKNGIAATNTIMLAATDMTQGGDYFGISLDHPVILKEDAHLDVNGNEVPASSPTSRLALTYSGNTAGEIEISSNDSNVRLRDGLVLRDLPLRVDVSEPYTHQWEVDLSQVSEDVHEIEFASRFTPAEGEVSFDNQATLRIAKLTLEADEPWPENRRRHVFGPRESATARIEPVSLAPIWRDGARQASGSSFALPAPDAALDKNISVEIAGTSIDIPLRYIAPSGVAADSARAMTTADWAALNMPEPTIGKVGTGLYTEVHLEPSYVSFTNVWIREGYSPALGQEGYFTRVLPSPHNESNGAGQASQIFYHNSFIDRAGHSNNNVTEPPAVGSFHYDIPLSWSADNITYMPFCVNTQAYSLSSDGKLTVTKFGCSCQRELDGTTTVTQPGGQ